MKKILCATDHSKISKKAEVFAANLAKDLGIELIYAYVSHITEDEMSPNAAHSSIAILKDVVLQEHDILAHARKVGKDVGAPKVQCVLFRSRKVARTLIDYVKKEGIDHIVVGAASSAGLTRLVLGSVANKIVEKAPCPVTMVS